MKSEAAHRFVCWLLCPAAAVAVGKEAEEGEGGERESGGFGHLGSPQANTVGRITLDKCHADDRLVTHQRE